MTILVTGAAGFIGTNLCKVLLEEGKSVIGVDNFITGSQKNIEYLCSFPSFTFLQKDITDPKIIQELSAFPIEEIYELACPTGVENLKKLPLEMLLTSTIGIKNILDLAVIKKAKFLFSSSSEVYGDPEITPQKETYSGNVNCVSIRSVYEEGKRCAESFVAAYSRKFGLDAKIVRIFNTYGPFFSEKDIRAIPQFVTQILNNQSPVIYGDGKKTRSFLYIDDLVSGFFLVMKEGTSGKAYNLGSTEEISMQKVCEVLVKISGFTGKIIHQKEDSLDLKNKRLPDVSEIKSLGWKQTVSLEEGFRKTLSIHRRILKL